MATYKEIKGVTVQTRDEDPVENVGSWSSGGALNTGRSENAGVGILTAALSVGGNTSPGATAVVEQYNGTAWTEVGDLNTARRNMGAGGTYTSSIVAGGDTPGSDEVNVVETWDGSSWTETTDLNTARKNLRGAGASNTATVVFGGQIPPNSPGTATDTGVTELWNGSSWTETGDLNTGRHSGAGFGISTAAIMAGGQSNPPDSKQAATEQFNGSSWTEIADISVRSLISGAGTTTSGLVFGGLAPPGSAVATTESWDGSSWTEVNDMATAIYKGAGCGASSLSALSFGGHGYVTTTQEWEFPPATQAKLKEGLLFLSGGTTLKGFGKAAGIPSTSWASGGSLNAGRYRVSASNTGGTVSASIIFGGYAPSSPPPNNYFASTESYDGTSFTEVNDLNTARSSASGFGSSTSAIMAVGNQGPKAQTELWNGTSWTEVNDVNTGRSQLAGGGISGTAGLIFGGSLPGYSMQSKTETWNGTSWTETGDLNLARDELAGSGVQTAAFAVAGKVKESGGPPTWYESNTHEQWDGSSWTETTEINTAVSAASAAGHTSSGLKIGGTAGSVPSGQTKTEFWNGSSWTELNDLSTQRQYLAQGSGTGVSNIVAGGYNGSTYGITNNEEWESDNTLSDVTVS